MNNNNTYYNEKLPGLIYGTAWKKERTADLVVEAVLAGFRGIDTAAQPKHYREDLVGTALTMLAGYGHQRESLFLQSKFTPVNGQDPKDIPYDPKAALQEQVRQSFSGTLKNLHTGWVDSLVLHSPLATPAELMEVWSAMESLADAGQVKWLGISNCDSLKVLQYLWQHSRIKPKFLQNRFYQETNYDRQLRAWCLQEGIVYQSFWTLSANPHFLQNTVVQNMARRLQKTPAQLLFRYLRDQGIVPLTGTTAADHMQQALDTENFSLSSNEQSELAAALYNN